MNEPPSSHKGARFRVVHCAGALESFVEARRHLKAHERDGKARALVGLIKRLADGHRMSSDSFPPEGDLPQGAGKFHAFKRVPIRAYVWRSRRLNNTYFISHYVHKDYRKLKQADIDRVGENWRRIEVDGHER